jgi:protein-L-isoaspartate O-methyltransferase
MREQNNMMNEDLQEIALQHPEIKEAMDAMDRITNVENLKARQAYENKPAYYPII